MKIITKALAKKIPALYTNEHKKPEDVKVPLKLFNPTGQGTWYITEMNPETGEAFGFVDLFERELGYIDMNELTEYRGKFGLGIERDKFWDPNTTLAQVMAGEKR